jgi:hypothetical protein
LGDGKKYPEDILGFCFTLHTPWCRCRLAASRSKDMDISGVDDGNVDQDSPVWANREDQSEQAAKLQDLGIALTDRFACSPRLPHLKAHPHTANIHPHASTHHSHHQLSSQRSSSISRPLKRKYKVTTMADSPLKLRISYNKTPSLGLDGGSDENPSAWDALAGEDDPPEDIEPSPDRSHIPTGQLAQPSTQATSTPQQGSQHQDNSQYDEDEIFEVYHPPSPPPTLY